MCIRGIVITRPTPSLDCGHHFRKFRWNGTRWTRTKREIVETFTKPWTSFRFPFCFFLSVIHVAHQDHCTFGMIFCIKRLISPTRIFPRKKYKLFCYLLLFIKKFKSNFVPETFLFKYTQECNMLWCTGWLIEFWPPLTSIILILAKNVKYKTSRYLGLLYS